MKIGIQLCKETVGRLSNREPFLLPDNLIFDVKSIGYDLTSAFITLKNGNIQDKYKLTLPFVVPDKFLFAGILNFSIDAYQKGELYKHWAFLPIKIIETNEGLECFDLLADIDKRVKALEKLHEII